MSDGKWRTISCICDAGTEHRLTLGGYIEVPCEWCENGTIFLRPSGHAFSYPGGKALGSYPGAYGTATPYTSPEE